MLRLNGSKVGPFTGPSPVPSLQLHADPVAGSYAEQ